MTTTNETSNTAWEQAIAEQTEEAPSKGLQEGEILSTNSDEFATRVSSLRYKGYLPYWDSKTGDYNEGPQYMRWQISQFTHADGSQKYTFTDPHITPDHGLNLFCPLNPDAPEYHTIKAMGFAPCRKRHIPHHDAVDAHLQKSHKRAYAALERSRATAARDEDRALQMEMLRSNQSLIQTLASQAVTQPTPVAVEEKVATASTSICANCGKDFTKATESATMMALLAHGKACKK